MPLRRVAVLASGKGTGFADLARAAAAGEVPVTVPLLVVNEPNAGALTHARELGVRAEVLDHRAFATREAYDRALVALLERGGVDLVFLLGFRRLVTKTLLDAFDVFNVHPSLLPAFPGLHAVSDALRAGVGTTGATVHRVDEGIDTGPILASTKVPILPGDDVAILHARIQIAERALVRSVLRGLYGSDLG